MKKCPVCHQSFTRTMILSNKVSQPAHDLLGEHLADGKGVIRCPHCKARLRKKFSLWFALSLIPFLISAVLSSIDHQLGFLLIPTAAIFIFVYICLPYVPYDN